MTGGLRSGVSDVVGLLIIYNLLHAVLQLLPLSPVGRVPGHQRVSAGRGGGNAPEVSAVRAGIAGHIDSVGLRFEAGAAVGDAAADSAMAGESGDRILTFRTWGRSVRF